MFCPTCKEVNLVLAERQGVEIDYCPKCRGVWLDRGELDKILQRAEGDGRAPGGAARLDTQPVPPPQSTTRRSLEDDDDDDDRHYDDRHDKRRKRGGFLGELFDWD